MKNAFAIASALALLCLGNVAQVEANVTAPIEKVLLSE